MNTYYIMKNQFFVTLITICIIVFAAYSYDLSKYSETDPEIIKILHDHQIVDDFISYLT